MKLHNYFKVFCAFALLVLLVSCPIDYPYGPQVATPSIQANPNRAFGNDIYQLQITLATTPADADIFFTLDGSIPSATNGTRYTVPFSIPTAGRTSPGLVELRAIGIRENHPDSSIATRVFQVFPRVSWHDFSGTTQPGTGIGYGGPTAPDPVIGVTLTLTNGVITNVIFSGHQTDGYWDMARSHVENFLLTMNCWNFLPVSGATLSSNGLRDAAREALESISPPAP